MLLKKNGLTYASCRDFNNIKKLKNVYNTTHKKL